MDSPSEADHRRELYKGSIPCEEALQTGNSTTKKHPNRMFNSPNEDGHRRELCKLRILCEEELRTGHSTSKEHLIGGSTRRDLNEHEARYLASPLLFSISASPSLLFPYLLCLTPALPVSPTSYSPTFPHNFLSLLPSHLKHLRSTANNSRTAQWENPAPQPS